MWDYINRAMPMFLEGSLKPDEVYALTALVLYKKNII
jgi:cytochrome c